MRAPRPSAVPARSTRARCRGAPRLPLARASPAGGQRRRYGPPVHCDACSLRRAGRRPHDCRNRRCAQRTARVRRSGRAARCSLTRPAVAPGRGLRSVPAGWAGGLLRRARGRSGAGTGQRAAPQLGWLPLGRGARRAIRVGRPSRLEWADSGAASAATLARWAPRRGRDRLEGTRRPSPRSRHAILGPRVVSPSLLGIRARRAGKTWRHSGFQR